MAARSSAGNLVRTFAVSSRYVREDAVFMIFGLVLAGGSLLLLRMHRRTLGGAAQAVPGDGPA